MKVAKADLNLAVHRGQCKLVYHKQTLKAIAGTRESDAKFARRKPINEACFLSGQGPRPPDRPGGPQACEGYRQALFQRADIRRWVLCDALC